MQDMFASYDTDGNGTMDAAELKALLSAIGLPLDEVQLAGVMEEVSVRCWLIVYGRNGWCIR